MKIPRKCRAPDPKRAESYFPDMQPGFLDLPCGAECGVAATCGNNCLVDTLCQLATGLRAKSQAEAETLFLET